MKYHSTAHFCKIILAVSLPTPFFSLKKSVLVSISVFMALSTVFHSIDPPESSLLSPIVLPVIFLPYCSFNYIYLYESLPSPDIIHSG